MQKPGRNVQRGCTIAVTMPPVNHAEFSPSESRSASQTARATLLLREMVIEGQFRPGERIKEIPLAARLHVSRIP